MRNPISFLVVQRFLRPRVLYFGVLHKCDVLCIAISIKVFSWHRMKVWSAAKVALFSSLAFSLSRTAKFVIDLPVFLSVTLECVQLLLAVAWRCQVTSGYRTKCVLSSFSYIATSRSAEQRDWRFDSFRQQDMGKQLIMNTILQHHQCHGTII